MFWWRLGLGLLLGEMILLGLLLKKWTGLFVVVVVEGSRGIED